MDLSIVVVSYNTKELTVKCIASIIAETKGIEYEIIVIDNASSDCSTSALAEKFPKIILIENDRNLGFAKANNQGIKIAKGRWILLLNSDTEVISNCLYKTVKFANSKLNIGVVGCKVLSQDRALQYSCWHFPNILTELISFSVGIIKEIGDPVTSYKYMKTWDHDESRMVDCVSGCFFMINREIFEKVGFLDEGFFMFYEDSEFCKRVKLKSTYTTYYFSEGEIVHLGGMSWCAKSKVAMINSYSSVCYYLQKCYGIKHLRVFQLLIHIIWMIQIFFLSGLWFSPKAKEKKSILNALVKM